MSFFLNIEHKEISLNNLIQTHLLKIDLKAMFYILYGGVAGGAE